MFAPPANRPLSNFLMNLNTIPLLRQSGESGETINKLLLATKRDENGKESITLFRFIGLSVYGYAVMKVVKIK